MAGLFLEVLMFLGFLGVSSFVETPRALVGSGFTSSVLAASVVVYLLPGALPGVVTAPLAGRLVSRHGGKPTHIVSMIVAAAGFTFMAALRTSSWQLIVGALAVNTAVTFGYAAMPALLVAHVPV